jgi:hypothetical protein
MVKEIPLGRGMFALVDDEDYDRITVHPWRTLKNRDGKFYVIGNPSMKGKLTRTTLYMHREIIPVPFGMEIDHINGNRLDNRKSNLRVCDRQQNCMNASKRKDATTSKFKGVGFDKRCGKWRARVMLDRKEHWCGHYELEHDAAIAYNSKAKELFGEFARLNEVD